MKKFILTLTTAIFFFHSNINAQKRDSDQQTSFISNIPKFSTDSSLGTFHADMNGLNITAQIFITYVNEWLGVNKDHAFKFISKRTDEIGITHSIYQHIYKGTKVENEIIILHEKNGKLTFVNGELTSNISLTAYPLSEEKVKAIIAKEFPENVKINFSTVETVISKVLIKDKIHTYHSSKIEAGSLRPLKSFIYYIDNFSQKIVQKISKNYTIDTPSVSTTINRGNQQITVDSYSGGYRLRDNARKIHTLDGTNLNGNTEPDGSASGGAEYSNSTANYTLGSTKPPVEIHWGMKKTYDYYVARHNRNSYDGNGSIIRNYYNFDQSGGIGPYDGTNAFALDQPDIVAMVYGNGMAGNTPLYNPIVMLDVAGHEYTHLVIGRNGLGGLVYQNESGALNESISDILGTCIEFFSDSNANWTIGEGFYVNPPLNAPNILRSLATPNIASDPQPDTYQGTYWKTTVTNPNQNNDYGGVHTNSGVSNYWFYLLSVGGSGTNDIGNTYSVNGIGIQKAEKIIYRALINYMTPNSTFMSAYNATKMAIADLYGSSSNEALQNIKAWYAVGIGNGVLSTKEIIAEDSNVEIYPNPITQNFFTINMKEKYDAKYEIYDVSGKLLILSKKLNAGKNDIRIDDIQNGMYILKINLNENVISKKIIVDKH